MVEESNLANAKLVVSALQIEDTNHLLAHRCKTLNVPTVIHAFERSVIDGLRRENVAYRITMEAIVANSLTARLREEGVVPA